MNFTAVNDTALVGDTKVNITFPLGGSAIGYNTVSSGATITLTVAPGSIEGTITDNGVGTAGTVWVGAWDASKIGGDFEPENLAPDGIIAAAGNPLTYTINNLPPADYIIAAYRDLDGGHNDSRANPVDIDKGEAIGAKGIAPLTQDNFQPVTLASGQSSTGNDFGIYDYPYINYVSTGSASTHSPDANSFTFAPGTSKAGEWVMAQVSVGYADGVDKTMVRVVNSGSGCNDSIFDDGVLPDLVAGDGIFKGFICQDNVNDGNYDFIITDTKNGLMEWGHDDLTTVVDLTSPAITDVGDRINTTAPMFQWTTVTNAFKYKVVIYDLNDSTLAPADILAEILLDSAATSYTMGDNDAVIMVNGHKYGWDVTAMDNAFETYARSVRDDFRYDNELPETVLNVSGIDYPDLDNATYYFKNDKTINLVADESGTVFYRINGGAWANDTNQADIVLDTDGTYFIEYYTTDLAGNQESSTQSWTIVIDKTKPVLGTPTPFAAYPAPHYSGVTHNVTLPDANDAKALYYQVYDHAPGDITELNDSTQYNAEDLVAMAAVDNDTVEYWLALQAVDTATNVSDVMVYHYVVSTIAPETTLYLIPYISNKLYANKNDTPPDVGVSVYSVINHEDIDIYNKVSGSYPAAYFNGTYLNNDPSRPTVPYQLFNFGGYLLLDLQANSDNAETYVASYPQGETNPVKTAFVRFLPGEDNGAAHKYDPFKIYPNACYQNLCYKDINVNPYSDGTNDSFQNQEFTWVLSFFSNDSNTGLREPTQSVTLYLDYKNPDVAIDGGIVSNILNVNSAVITGTASDGFGLAGVEVSVDNGVTWNAANLNGTNWTYTATLALGPNTIVARATDNAGNVSEAAENPVLTYYPPLMITVDGANVTDGHVYVPNSDGHNTKTVVLTGGSEAFFNDSTGYTWVLTNDSAVHLSGAGMSRTLTADIGEKDNDLLTINDSVAGYTATLEIRVVELAIGGENHIVTNASDSSFTAQGNVGQVKWTVDNPSIASITGVSGTNDATVTIAVLTTGTFTLTANDSATGAIIPMTIQVVSPLTITNIGNRFGISEDQTLQFAVTGGTGNDSAANYTWTVDNGTLGAIDATGLFTPAAGTGDRVVNITATDKTYGDVLQTAALHVVDPITITSDENRTGISDVETLQFAATGGTGNDNPVNYTWTVDNGTLGAVDISGLFTPAVGTGDRVVVISATDKAYTNVVQTFTLHVVDPLTITSAGNRTGISDEQTLQFAVTGGTGNDSAVNYTWTVNNDSLGAVDANGLFTPAAGTGKREVNISATDKTYVDQVDTFMLNVVDPITITNTPANNNMEAGAANDFNFTDGSGNVNWSVVIQQGKNVGTINQATGMYTAPVLASGDAFLVVTIEAIDAEYSNVVTTYDVTIHPAVTVINKPATPPVLQPGTLSTPVTVTGGEGAYIWTVTNPAGDLINGQNFPAYTGNTATFTFKAPTLERMLVNGFTAGVYTINVADPANPTFVDSFTVYVPIQLVAVKTADGAAVQLADIVPPVFDQNQMPKFWAAGGGTNLSIDITAQQPVTVGTNVLTADAATQALNPFKMNAAAPGFAEITVKPTNDTDGNFKGMLKATVIGVSNVTGRVSGYPTDINPVQDVKVRLRDPNTRALLREVAPGADGAFTFADVRWGSYFATIVVNDAAYVPFFDSAMVNVTQPVSGTAVDLTLQTAIYNLTGDLVPILQSYTLQVSLTGLQNNDTLAYVLLNNQTFEVVQDNTAYDYQEGTPLTLQNLEAGSYRLLMKSAGYQPQHEYRYANNALTRVIMLDETRDTIGNDTVNDNIIKISGAFTAQPGFVVNPPRVSASHIFTDTGFSLSMVVSDFAGAIDLKAVDPNNAQQTIDLGVTGTGTAADPYRYEWTTDDPNGIASVIPHNNDTSYLTMFRFYDGAAQVGRTYPVMYVEWKTDAAEEEDRDQDQVDLEENLDQEYQGETQYIIEGENIFYPLDGTDVDVTLKDSTGAERQVVVVIPPLPLEYLFIDDSDGGANNLAYNQADDVYELVGAPARMIDAKTVLRVEVTYYSLGGDAIGTGATLQFFVYGNDSGAGYDGLPVRYNPIIVGQDNVRQEIGEVTDAPVITLPQLLNTQSRLFSRYQRLSDSQKDLIVSVKEKGDGITRFHNERAAFSIGDDGLVLIEATHLSTWGLSFLEEETAAEATESLNLSGSSCFINSAADAVSPLISTRWIVAGLMVSLFAGLTAMVRKRVNSTGK